MAIPFREDPVHWGQGIIFGIEICLYLLLFKFCIISPIIAFTVRQLCHQREIYDYLGKLSTLQSLCIDTENGSLLYQELIIPVIIVIVIRMGVAQININNLRQTLLTVSTLGLIICAVPLFTKLIHPEKTFDDLIQIARDESCPVNLSSTEKDVFPIGIDVGTSFMRVIQYDKNEKQFKEVKMKDSCHGTCSNYPTYPRFGNTIERRNVVSDWTKFMFMGIEKAEKQSGSKVSHLVIAIPSTLGFASRQFVKKSLGEKISGLNVQFITEATAAAIAHGRNIEDIKGNILVMDIGAGKLDLTILNRDRLGVFSVIATGGDESLGGDKFSARCFHDITEELEGRKNSRLYAAIAEQCEETIQQLSTNIKGEIKFMDAEGRTITHNMKRTQFEKQNEDLINSILDHVDKTVAEAGDKKDIQHVWFTGGTSKMPKIQKVVKNYFRENKNMKIDVIDNGCVVAEGAAIMATRYAGITVPVFTHLFDVMHDSVGTKINKNGLFSTVIPKNTRIPTKMTRSYITLKDNQRDMDCSILEGGIEEEQTYNLPTIIKCILDHFKQAPAGDVKVLHSLEINSQGNLKLTVEEEIKFGNERNVKTVVLEDYVSPTL